MSGQGPLWGLSHHPFLVFYLAAAVGVAGVVAVALCRIFFLRRRTDPEGLSPYEVAYVTGGAWQAVFASLAMLRHVGAVHAWDYVLHDVGECPPDASRLDRAIHRAAGAGAAAADLLADPEVHAALEEIRVRLEHAGLVIPVRLRRRLRGAMLMVIAIGLARLIVGLASAAPVTFLASVLGSFAMLTWWFWYLLARPATSTGRWAVARLTDRYSFLAPWNHPAWTTYGRNGAAMAVALFGAAALYDLDGAFTDGAGIGLDTEAAASHSESRAAGGGATAGSDGAGRDYPGGACDGGGAGCGGGDGGGGGGGGGCGGGGGG